MDFEELQLNKNKFVFYLDMQDGKKFKEEFSFDIHSHDIRWELEAIARGYKLTIILKQTTSHSFTFKYKMQLLDSYAKRETVKRGIKDTSGSQLDGKNTSIKVEFNSISGGREQSPYLICTLLCYIKLYNLHDAFPEPLKKINTDFESMLEGGQFSDCAILTDASQKIAVHKNILGARSSVFRAMLECPMTESSTGEILIKDFSEDVIKRMLIYMYAGKTAFENVEKTMELLTIADKYDLPDLSNISCRFLANNLETSTCLKVLKTAYQLSIKWLEDVTADFILDNMMLMDKAEILKLDSRLLTRLQYTRVF